MAFQGLESLRRAIALAIAVMAGGVLAGPAHAGDFDFDRYQPTSYAQVLGHVRPMVAGQLGDGTLFLVDPDAHPWRLRVAYAGEVRPLRAGIRRVISDWVTTRSAAPSYRALFDHEVAFETHEGRIWLPVQTQLLDDLAAEARAGTPVELYVTLLGSLDEEPVLTVNEFRVDEYVD